MEDDRIVELFWVRDQGAIAAAAEQYSSYCVAIARKILGSVEDAEECVNDTWLAAWNAIPPNRPEVLSAFLGRLTRNIALNRLKRDHAEKRGGSASPIPLDELAEIVSDTDTAEAAYDRRALLEAINAWLGGLTPTKRGIFVRRCWHFDRVNEIAARYGMRENTVSVTLRRLRTDLRRYLTERGFSL